ncbi:MAG: amino acid adenylation domain-containing protein [Ruminococcus sp.]|nr:amino acid adenylation domain-containing protein [Ruminococcus sp.]
MNDHFENTTEKRIELSPSQSRILIAELNHPGTKAYHLYSRLTFAAGDRDWLIKAIPYIFCGNFSLRLGSSKKTGYMLYSSPEEIGFEEHSVSGDEKDVQELISGIKSKGIAPLSDSPLYRIHLISTGQELVLFCVFHHLIADGTTVQSVFPRLIRGAVSELKAGKTPAALNVTFDTYIDRVKSYSASDEAKADAEYWIDKLSGYHGIGYKAEGLDKGVVSCEIPADTTEKLKTAQSSERISPFVTGLTSAFLYFMKCRSAAGSASKDMVWEISVHGRYFGEDIAGEAGMYVATLPLRLVYDPSLSFADSLKYVKSEMKAGLSHARTDTNEYFGELKKTGGDLRSLTSFSAVSNPMPEDGGEMILPDETDVPFHIRVNLNRRDSEGLQSLTFEYNSTLFKQEDIEQIRDGISDLIKQAAEDPGKPVSGYAVSESRLISAECLIERNMAAADEPVYLQSGMNRSTKEQGHNARSSGKITDKDMTDKYLLTAALADTLVRFGMTKDILFGVKYGVSVLPFGLSVDTSLPAAELVEQIRPKLARLKEISGYDMSCRTDINFDPSVVLSFREAAEIRDGAAISVCVTGEGTQIIYSRLLYTDEYMSTFHKSLKLLYGEMTSQKPLRDILLVKEKSGHHSISLANEGTVNAVFERLAALSPDKEILFAADRSMTYKELDDAANRLGNALIKRGVKPGDRVLLLMRRTSQLVVSVFGVLKAGAVFITMDPDYPRERIDQILEDSEAALILTDIAEIERSMPKAVGYRTLAQETDTSKPSVTVSPDSMCFIIYTSGTTGRPKGVVLSHRGITNYVAAEPENAPMYCLKEKCSKMLCLSSVSFIVFLREIFGTILNGVQVVLCSEEQAVDPSAIAGLIDSAHIDAMGSTPTRLLQYIEIPKFAEALSSIKVMIIGGEGFPGRLYNALRKHTACDIFNSYGPTEVTVASHQKKMESSRVSAGFTMLNVWDRIADPDGNELPPYAAGELYVGGAGVAIGYFRDPEMTSRRFPVIEGERYCNTGDLAYKDASGEVFVLGRNDGMIKLRGLRIELEEIENNIGNYPGIAHARVVVRTVQGTEHLCAFYTLKKNVSGIKAEDIRKHISKKLPSYMVPSYYTCLKEFPMTPNGKVAVKVLKDYEIDTSEGRAFEAPVTEEEKQIFELVSKTLGTDNFGVRDDLFTVGLTSLTMVSVISAIYEKYGISFRVTDFMKLRCVALLAEETARLTAVSDTAKPGEELLNNDEQRDYYPLTENQLGIYLDCIAHPGSIGYHLPNIIRFDASVSAERLKNAVSMTIGFHKYLKVTLVSKGGDILQKRDDSRSVLQDITIVEADEFTEEDARKFAAIPFDLNGGSLFRFRIVRTPTSTILLSVFHHLITDGGSLNIIFRDIAAAYDGRELSAEGTDGYQLSVNEKIMLNSPAYVHSREYYAGRFAIADSPTILTPNLKGEASEGKLGVERVGISASLVDALCKEQGISQNVLFMSALFIVLSKFNSEDKLLLATVSNGRLDPSARNTVALMVRTLPLVLKEDRSESISELFKNVGSVWMDTMANQLYPFTKLAGEFDIHPEFFYTYHGKIYDEISLGGKNYPRGRIAFDSLRYKTMVNVILEDRYYIQTEYNDVLYSPEYIRCFLECMRGLIENWFCTKDLSVLRIRDISLGDEKINYDFHPLKETMVNRVIERMASEQPDLPILTCQGVTMTYDELNRRANRIAHALRKRGVKDDGRVVLLMPRTADLIVSMVAVLKAGACYIPMDVEYPEERVNYVVEDSEADFIITDRDLPKHISVSELLEETDETNLPTTIDGDRLSYMIYTSGSTGRPKGVELTNRGLANVMLPVPENNYYYTRPDKPASVLETATVSFDISVLDIIGCLTNGMKLIFADDEQNRDISLMVKLIKETKPEAIGMMTPSRLLQYMSVPEFAEAAAPARMCSVGGEPFLPALYDRIREYSDMDIYNAYGPSETTIISNTRIAREELMTSVGNALYNVQCDIRDLDGKMLPDGVVGEMYIGGYGVGRGYHNLPEKTAAGFIKINNVPYFRSGDFCYRLPDGNFMVLGRRDNQIKLRGLRVEIGEIEQSMLAYPAVREAAVIIRKIGKTDHLCGYFTAEEKVDANDLKAFLSSRLTPYMVPTVLMQLDSMPYTPNGKLDRKTLPEPVITRSYSAPVNDEEEFFCRIFGQVLETDEVGATDDFFAVGGSSLLATQLTIAASNGGYEIRYRDIFDNPTPRKLAAFVREKHGDASTVTDSDERDIREYDYTSIHDHLKNNTIANYISGQRKKFRRVLLTGATGFLGIHVLRELLENEDISVYCMLRGKEKLSPLKRLMGQLFYYSDNDYSELNGIRLFAKEGAITDADSFKAFDDTELDAVINCAASVKHFSAGNDIYDTNVNGVKNGLEYAVARGIRYIHISTTSSAGEIPADNEHELFTYDEQVLYKGQILDNQYLSSKFLSERLVLQAAADGADAKVIRVGNLMARDSDGIFQINFRSNGFISRLKAYVTMHMMPYAKMLQKVEFSPIDVTAKAIVSLASSPKECCLFNCYNNHTVTYADILRTANENGLGIKPAEDQRFAEALEEAMHDSEKQKGLYGLVTTVGMGTKKERILTPVSNDYTVLALCNDNIYWPILSENYLDSFVDFLKGMGYWDD